MYLNSKNVSLSEICTFGNLFTIPYFRGVKLTDRRPDASRAGPPPAWFREGGKSPNT